VLVEEVIGLIETFIQDLNAPQVSKLFSLLPPGKMLRSKLILEIAKSKEAILLSAVVEMIHTASLLHDDVIDKASLRRGVPALNVLYGDKSAVMLGDILYSKAFYELTNLPEPIPKIISFAVSQLSLGELLDVQLSQEFNPSPQRYMEMIEKKTASLIEASTQTAAILANRNPQIYGLYGKNLGLAFQIVDDILDITQESSVLGKPALSDFKEGKTTLPYIYLYHSLNTKDQQKLLKLFKKELSSSQKEWLRDKFKETGAIERAKSRAKELGLKAVEALDSKEDRKLKEIITLLIDRTY